MHSSLAFPQILPVPVAGDHEHHCGHIHLCDPLYLYGADMGEGRHTGLRPPEEAGLAEAESSCRGPTSAQTA